MSLSKIKQELDIEVLVLENHSKEQNQIRRISLNYPQFKFHFLNENIGYGRANNQGVDLANSENIWILNPDTIVSKATLMAGIDALTEPKVGAVAVKMYDGNGVYLPESRRGLPTISGSIWKLLGLNKVFSESNFWNQYYKGSKNIPDEIEVMSGACFFMKKSMYQQLGGFDERFFMYGEDIDFSFRIHKAGYLIRYIEQFPIIHFKGRSSPRHLIQFQNAFYDAMYIYWEKHYQSLHTTWLNILVRSVVWAMKLISWVSHVLALFIWPCIDAIVLYGFIAAVSHWWARYIKFDLGFFPPSFFYMILPLYTMIWIGSLMASGFYQRDIELKKLLKGSTLGTMLTLLVYFLLPSDYKFSRGILMFGIGAKFFLPWIIRYIVSKFVDIKIRYSEFDILRGRLDPSDSETNGFDQTLHRISNYRLFEKTADHQLIMRSDYLSNENLIMTIMNQSGTMKWIYAEKEEYMIYTTGKNERSLILAMDTELPIDQYGTRTLKRATDIGIACMLYIYAGLGRMIGSNSMVQLYTNAREVLLGSKSWVSIWNAEVRNELRLKPGVIEAGQNMNAKDSYQYLRYTKLGTEYVLLIKSLFKL